MTNSLSPSERKQAEDALDSIISASPEHYDSLAKHYETQEKQDREAKAKTDTYMNGLFRSRQPTHEE